MQLQYLHKMVQGVHDIGALETNEANLQQRITQTTQKIESLRKVKTEVVQALDTIKEEITRNIAAGSMVKGDTNEKTDQLTKLQSV